MWGEFLSSHALTALFGGLAMVLLGWPIWRLHCTLKLGQARREQEAVRQATRAFGKMKADQSKG